MFDNFFYIHFSNLNNNIYFKEREAYHHQSNDDQLLDSLDTNRKVGRNNLLKNTSFSNQQNYSNNLNQSFNNITSTTSLQNRQLLLQQQPINQSSAPQFQPIIPIPATVPQQGLFTIIPSPSSNSLPIVQTSLQFQHPHAQHSQFFQIPIQQQQFLPTQPNMFYQEPIFYNTAYPVNFATGPNGYFPLSNDFNQNENFIYEEPNRYYDSENNQTNLDYQNNNQINSIQSQLHFQKQQQLQQKVFSKQNPSNQNKQSNKLNFNKNNIFDAQPFIQPTFQQQPLQQQSFQQQSFQQPPQTNQRFININNDNNNQPQYSHSQHSNESYDSPLPFNEIDDVELNNEFSSLKANNEKLANFQNNRINELNEEDTRRQQVWNKLQKDRETKNKQTGSGIKNKQGINSGLPPVPIRQTLKKTQTLPLVEKKDNFLEKNIDAIKNKENLAHRYPNKKYETIHGKNSESRLKLVQE